MTSPRIAALLIALALGLVCVGQAHAEEPQSGADFARRCLTKNAHTWRAVWPGPFPDATSSEEITAKVTAWQCNSIVATAWMSAPNGAYYQHCGDGAMPMFKRQVILAYVRQHLPELKLITQETMIVSALREAFDCKPEIDYGPPTPSIDVWVHRW